MTTLVKTYRGLNYATVEELARIASHHPGCECQVRVGSKTTGWGETSEVVLCVYKKDHE